jgi:MFS family permease
VRDRLHTTFRSLRIRNFRLYFVGQLASMFGTWMQMVALAWLVVELTGSGTSVGLVTAAQFAPVLLVGAWGGLIADRFDNRKAVLCVQLLLAAQSALLAVVVLTGAVEMWMVYGLAVLQGVGNALDTPTRQALIGELVGEKELTNAVALNAVLFQLARIAGPLMAGVLITTVGIGVCFACNAASYLAIVVALLLIDPRRLIPRVRAPRAKGQLREAVRYARGNRTLWSLLSVTALVGTLSFQLNVLLPLVAKYVFDGGASTFATMSALAAFGGLIAAVGVAARRWTTNRQLLLLLLALGATMFAAAAAPTLAAELVVMVPLGMAMLAAPVTINASVQLVSRPDMRGRAISFYFLLSQGSNVIGAPVIGWIAQNAGARWSMVLGAVAAVLGAAGWYAHAHGHLGEPLRQPEAEAAPAVVPAPHEVVPAALTDGI